MMIKIRYIETKFFKCLLLWVQCAHKDDNSGYVNLYEITCMPSTHLSI